MIGAAKFNASRNAVGNVLKKADVYGTANSFPAYPADMPGELRQLSYHDVWSRCSGEGWYDYRLLDSSLIQYRRTSGGLAYSFLPVPVVPVRFEDFAYNSMGPEWEVVEEELRHEYEIYLGSDLEERMVTPIRYDYEPGLYRRAVHPAGHVHFGRDNDIRVCTTKIMNPVSFALFVVRQYYPNNWESRLCLLSNKTLMRQVRDALDDVPKAFFSEMDFWEVQLN